MELRQIDLDMRLLKLYGKIIYLTSYWIIDYSSFSKKYLTNLLCK